MLCKFLDDLNVHRKVVSAAARVKRLSERVWMELRGSIVNSAPLFPPLTEEHHLAERVEDTRELRSVRHNQGQP